MYDYRKVDDDVDLVEQHPKHHLVGLLREVRYKEDLIGWNRRGAILQGRVWFSRFCLLQLFHFLCAGRLDGSVLVCSLHFGDHVL